MTVRLGDLESHVQIGRLNVLREVGDQINRVDFFGGDGESDCGGVIRTSREQSARSVPRALAYRLSERTMPICAGFTQSHDAGSRAC